MLLFLVFFVCLFLSRSESGAPCVGGVHSSNTHCVAVYRPISTWFRSFFGSYCPFIYATQFSHSSLGGATIFAKLRSKIAKSTKIGGKVCAHHFVQIADGFEKNLLQQFSAETVDVHVYNVFSARRQVALIANVKFRIGGPKTARKVQVVRTKSNTGSKFSEIFFEPLYTGWIVVVHLYCGFSLWCQMAPQQSAKFITAFLVNFVPV